MEGGEVIGTISDVELGNQNGAEMRRGKSVGDLLTANVAVVTSETTIRRAANLLRGSKASCLPVVDDGHLVGIVTATDLLEAVGSGKSMPPHINPRIRSSRLGRTLGRR